MCLCLFNDHPLDVGDSSQLLVDKCPILGAVHRVCVHDRVLTARKLASRTFTSRHWVRSDVHLNESG